MSYHVFFSFSTSLSKPMKVPKGTLKSILERIEATERILGLKRTPTYTPEGEKPRPGWHWSNTGDAMLAKAGPKTDTTQPLWWLADREREANINRMGMAVREHNAHVQYLYAQFEQWAKQKAWKRGTWERITPAQSVEFWGGLAMLDLPRELWDKEHFRAHMEHLHTLLTTGKSEGVTLDCEAMTPKQAGALIRIFEDELDQWGYDMRFDIPLDANLEPYGHVACSHDGGYDWCSHCGPIHSDDFHERCRVCPRAKTGECELKNEHPAEFEGGEQ